MAFHLHPYHVRTPSNILSAHSFPCGFLFPISQKQPNHRNDYRPRAVKEWQEYEEAVKTKDLGRALRFLKSIKVPIQRLDDDSSQTPLKDLDLYTSKNERDWEVLDTCLNADDMKLVTSAYSFLKEGGFLPNFGKFRSIGNFSSKCCLYYLVPS